LNIFVQAVFVQGDVSAFIFSQFGCDMSDPAHLRFPSFFSFSRVGGLGGKQAMLSLLKGVTTT
jgi:hypothetical protein